MKIFQSYCHKNVLKTVVLLLGSKSFKKDLFNLLLLKSFIFNNKSVEKNNNIQEPFFFSFFLKKTVPVKQEKLTLVI